MTTQTDTPSSTPCLGLELYRAMALIRSAEETIQKHYFDDEMKTPMHMSMGAEAIAAGVCQAIPDSQVFGTYRSHAIYLAKTGDVDGFFAEMYGKENAPLEGRGGSMHLCLPDKGFMGTSAIVGSSIPVAVGAAFANKQKKNETITISFFGEGAQNEGVFWESINMASLMKLPILFVCEDNGLAVHTKKSERNGYRSITDVVSQFDCHVLESSSIDVEEIHSLTRQAKKQIEETGKPCFLLLQYHRHLEHVGVSKDYDAPYREASEEVSWSEKDPVLYQRNKLVELEGLEEDVLKVEEEIGKEVGESLEKAKKASFTSTTELWNEVLS